MLKCWLLILLIVPFFLSCATEEDEELAELTTKHYAYVAATAIPTSVIVVFEINSSTGELTEVEQVNLSSTPQSMVVTDEYLYVGLFSGGIQVFSIAPSSGELTSVETESVSTTVSQLVLHPSQNFLYAESEESSVSSIQAYSIGSDGALTAVGSSTGLGLRMMSTVFANDGEDAFFVGYDADDSNVSQIYAATIGSDGAVTLGSVTNIPNNTTYATNAVMNSDASQMYVANSNGGFSAIARIALTDGELQVTDTSNQNATSGTQYLPHPSLDLFYSNYGVFSSADSGGLITHAVDSDGEVDPTLEVTTDASETAYDFGITVDATVIVSAKTNDSTPVVSSFTVDTGGTPTKAGEVDLSSISGITFAGHLEVTTITY